MQPSGIALARTYAFDEQTESKAQDWGELLWQRLRSLLAVPVPASLRAQEKYAYLSDRLANYVLSRLVVRGTQLAKTYRGLPEENLEADLKDLVDDILDLTATERDDIVWHLMKICPRIVTKGATPSGAQLGRIREFAHTNSHRCYLCGHTLIYASANEDADADVADDAPPEEKNPREFRSFEVEHIFPQKRGGSRSPRNLAASCKSCNKYKDILLSYPDLPIESMITISADPVNVKAAFGGIKKFALLWRQAGCCGRCSTPFFDASDERLVLLRRDRKDAYHFFNVEIACGACGDDDPEGVMLRA